MEAAPCFVAPGPVEAARPVVLRAPNAAKGKGFGATAQDQSSSGFLRLAAALVAGGAVQRAAYGKGMGRGGKGYGRDFGGGGRDFGGGGSFGGGRNDIQRLTEAKRTREAQQFFQYQKSLMLRGEQTKDERFYRQEEARLFKAAHVSAGIDFQKYDSIDVETKGGSGKEQAIETFQEACEKHNLPPALTANIDRCHYNIPTPVQKHSIPAVLSGSDVLVTAQTGSGKTAAFLVPIITAALNAGRKPMKEGAVCPTSVVLSPTRELCQQITVEAERLTFRSGARVCAIYGGADAIPQLRTIAGGVEIVVCTPGRLEDFLQRGVISMEEVKFLALDEADRMLDMGFEPQIREIIENHGMPKAGQGRQTMMFSATFPREIQELALDFLDRSYYSISVGRVGATAANVEQRFENIGWGDKFEQLLESLKEVKSADGGPAKTIVFANSKREVDDISYRLQDERIRCTSMHGGVNQSMRDRSLNALRTGRAHVLVATDVAARGLDLPGIDHVINYDLPSNGEDYVHRVGRTGRIGNKGVATSFVGSKEPALKDIVRSLKDAKKEDDTASEVPSWLEEMAFASRGGSRSSSRGGYGGYRNNGYRNGGGGGGGYGGYRDGGYRNGQGGFRSRSASPGYRSGGRGGYGGYDDRSSGYGDRSGGYGDRSSSRSRREYDLDDDDFSDYSPYGSYGARGRSAGRSY